jgi:hypothetical protein
MSGGTDSQPDAKLAVHHLDDAGNYLKICNFSNFKHWLPALPMTYCTIAILHMVL